MASGLDEPDPIRTSLDILEEASSLAKKEDSKPLTPYQQYLIGVLSEEVKRVEGLIKALQEDFSDPRCRHHTELDRYGSYFECKRRFGHEGAHTDWRGVPPDERN
jgi:hypothetical protein